MIDQTRTQNRVPKVAIVLSSGGIKAMAALPLFDFLRSQNIPIDLVVGTSGGAIVGALESLYDTHDEVIAQIGRFSDSPVFKSLDYRSILSMANLPFGRFDGSKGLLKKEKILQAGREILGDTRLEDLDTKTIVQTTDLQTAEGVVLEKGLLWEVLYATGCLYPLFAPIKIAGRWLVDGTFVAPLPILEAFKRGADIIIACYHINNAEAYPSNFLEAFSVLNDVGNLAMMKNQMALAYSMHHFEIIPIEVYCKEPVGLGGSENIPKLLEWGKEALKEKKELILSAFKDFSMD